MKESYTPTRDGGTEDTHGLVPVNSAYAWQLPCQAQPSWSAPVLEPEPERRIPVSHYFWVLKRHWWRILGFVTGCVLATAVVSSRLTPIFESTATVDVDRRMPTSVLGEENTTPASLNDADQFLATQVRLIQSDSVLRPVVKRFHIGSQEIESVDPGRFGTPDGEDAPLKLKKLKVSRPPNTYLLLISYRSPDPRLAADVANSVAQSYIEHTYNIRIRSNMSLSTFMEKQIDELKAKMERSSAALAQFEKELNVVNPEEKTNILSSRLLQLNSEYTTAQSDRVRKEAAVNSVRAGSLEAAEAGQGEGSQLLEQRLSQAREKFAEVKQHFGANHPEYRKAAAHVDEVERQYGEKQSGTAKRVEVEYSEAVSRENMLRSAVAETKSESDKLNVRSFEYRSLKQEAEGDKKLYDELVRKIKEAGLNAGFQGNSIRLADAARPAWLPVFPKVRLNILLAFLFSGLLAVSMAVIADVLDNTIRDPEQVRRSLNTDVIGNLPLVRAWKRAPARLLASGLAADKAPTKTESGYSGTTFEEAIATLRNSILLAHMDRPLRSILVTSASPSEGKTTTAVSLALAHARQKHRTLLIDCDLRRPGVDRILEIKRDSGLSDAVLNGLKWRDELTSFGDLDVLVAGPASRAAADLVGKYLPQILHEAVARYDLVIVDAPPALAFPEPLQMAAATDAVVLVARAGETNRKAIGTLMQMLARLHANVIGLVLNEVTNDMANKYCYHGYYGRGAYEHPTPPADRA